jgi:tetratricopeptide (TPR) repeat protein
MHSKIYKLISIVVVLITILPILISAQAANVSSYVPYDTYTYDYNGNPVITPHAYLPNVVLSGEQMGIGTLKNPMDVTTDKNNNVYIADSGNNRVLCLDKSYKLKFEIANFTSELGKDALLNPNGLFITSDGAIYVADTDNGRIVEFTSSGGYVRIINAPKTTLLSKDFVYKPLSLALDNAKNIFVVAKNTYEGIMHFSSTGKFLGFTGAQKVTYNPVDYAWKMILTKAQQQRMQSFVPTEYNNITIDKKGFLYVTTSAIDKEDLSNAISSHSKDNKYSPLKKINSIGNDVLKSNGYFLPLGDVNFKTDNTGSPMTSIIIDVALGQNGSYTLLDSTNNRLFTYSKEGELLYSFSGLGMQIGNSESPTAITYNGSDILLLDEQLGTLTVFSRTHYGDLINNAFALYNDYNYTDSVKVWNDVLKENATFDIAYDGIGNSYLKTGNYKEAMEYFSYSNNKQGYSDALEQYRNQFVEKNFLIIALLIALLVFFFAKIFKYISKRNKSIQYKEKQKTFSGEILYGFFILTHPFNGFWDLKHEKRGSIRGATTILGLVILTFLLQKLFLSYMFNPDYNSKVSIVSVIFSILMPFLLWVCANWSVTTLMSGEGKLKDIYIFSAYALLPLALLNLPMIPLSYFFILNEGMYISLFSSIAVAWTVFLILGGNLTTHQYSLIKSIISITVTVIVMAIIIFIVLLITSTYQKFAQFFINLFIEISYRL